MSLTPFSVTVKANWNLAASQ